MFKQTATVSVMKFADLIWQDIAAVRQMGFGDQLEYIYARYNHSNLDGTLDWQRVFQNFSQAIDQIGGLNFLIQHNDFNAPGSEVAKAFAALARMIENRQADLAGKEYVKWVKSEQPLAAKPGLMAPKAEKKAYRNRVKNLTRAQVKDLKLYKKLCKDIRHAQLRADPAVMLNDFLYHTAPGAHNSSKYRIYVTPMIEHGASVFAELVKFINDRGNLGEARTRIAPNARRPREGKLTLPGPRAPMRTDRIVIYCYDQEEMQTGVEWLRLYQQGREGLFEMQSPRGTKRVDGLRGVAVANEPDPSDAFKQDTGKDRWSFGSALSALLALALQSDPQTVNEFKQQIRFLSKHYNHDMGLKNVQL